MIDIQATFNKHEDEGIQNWKLVQPKLNPRLDLHAFLLLDRLSPGDKDIISDADHDIIYFGVDTDELAKIITEEQVIELLRCGVFYHNEHYCLAMFV